MCAAPRPPRPPGPPQPLPDAVAPYVPATLPRRALDVRIGGGLRELPPGEREAWVERRQRFLAGFDLRAPWRVARVKRFVLGSVLLLPLMNALVTSTGLHGYPWQVLIAAAYGLVLGLWRLPPPLSAAWTMAACVATVRVVTGHNLLVPCAGSILWLSLYGLVGYALGVSDDLTRDEDRFGV